VGLGARGGTCRITNGDPGSTAGCRDPKGDRTVTFQGNQGDTGLDQPATGTVRINGVDVRTDAQTKGAYLTHAFFWMFAGLLLTAGVAAFVQADGSLLSFGKQNFLLLILAQLGLALVIQFGIARLNATAALGMFFVYAASLGLTIGVIVSLYNGASVATAFVSAAGMFGGAALYGFVTKRSLAGIGGFAALGVFGLIMAIGINVFVGSSTVSLIISIIGVGLFTVLTAYHVQRIAQGNLATALGSSEKAAVIGALLLYLDFINLFLFLLRLTGGRR
jgi:FtsH-binding integral membrane protein